MPIISAVWGYIFGEKNLLPEHQCYSPEKKNNSSLLLSIQLCFGFGFFFFFWLLPPFILLLPGPLLSPLPQKEFACPPWIWCQSHQENVQAKKSWHKSAWLCSCRWRCVGLHTAWENWMPGLFCDHFVFIHSSFKFSITVLPWKLINVDPKPICTLSHSVFKPPFCCRSNQENKVKEELGNHGKKKKSLSDEKGVQPLPLVGFSSSCRGYRAAGKGLPSMSHWTAVVRFHVWYKQMQVGKKRAFFDWK